MKLCPQCEFLYEDDQVFCDMDGEGLVHDSRAEVFSEPSPAVASASRKHSRPRFMIGALLAGLLLSAVLSFAYYAATRSVDFDRVSPNRQPEPKLSQQIAVTSVDNSSAHPAVSPSPSQPDTASDSPSPSANEIASPSASPSGRAHSLAKSANSSSTVDTRLVISKRLAPLPQVNPLPQLASPQRLPAAKPTAALPVTATGKQKLPNETSPKSVIVEVKPPGRNQTKQSKVGSFLKKTGRLLAKPFKQ